MNHDRLPLVGLLSPELSRLDDDTWTHILVILSN
jgi:hypothetical protein